MESESNLIDLSDIKESPTKETSESNNFGIFSTWYLNKYFKIYNLSPFSDSLRSSVFPANKKQNSDG